MSPYPARTWFALLYVVVLLQTVLSSLDLPLGGRFTVHLPATYQPEFSERNKVLEAVGERQPGFAATLSVEAMNGEYICSLVVLLGDVKVWASDHSGQEFTVRAFCQLELTEDGQLQLTDGAGTVGWWLGTAGQRAQALHLDSMTGNLLLLNAKNHAIWQSFDSPTNKLLPGQRLHVPSYFHLSRSKFTSAMYYVEFDKDKIAAYLSFGQSKYSYWSLTPSHNESMAYAEMTKSGLTMFNLWRRPVLQISPAAKKAPVRFLALGDDGNLRLYFFDNRHKKFRASYMALGFCELPLACAIGGVCSAAGKCIDFSAYGVWPAHDSTLCNATAIVQTHDMVEIKGVTTVLKTESTMANLTMHRCVDLCLRNCSCAAAHFVKHSTNNGTTDNGVCSHYELTAGAREVIGGENQRYSYWVKVRKGTNYEGDGEDDRDKNTMFNKVLIIFGAVNILGLLLFTGLGLYYCFSGRKDAAAAEPNCNTGDAAVQNR